MTGFSDLLFVIEEAKKQKLKSNNILHRFNKHKEEAATIHKIQKKVELKFNSIPSKSTILNADIASKNNRILLYLKVPKVSGEVVVTFDSSFNIIDVSR